MLLKKILFRAIINSENGRNRGGEGEDENFLKDAEQMLFHEFQYVLKLESKEALRRYILAGTEP